jgi:DNA primase
LDIKELKNYIYENHFVEQILVSIKCHHIKYHSSGYWTCANHDGDNNTAIVIYNNELLICENYTRKMIKTNRVTDLIDLVCYNLNISIFEALKYLCNEVGLDYYHDFNEDIPESLKITRMLCDMNSNINCNIDDIPLKPIPLSILNYYKPYVNDLFYNDNIDYETQKEFQIGYDECTNRITIPIFSEIGDLVGVKGRLFKKDVDKDELKYLYIEPCARSRILYGLNKTLPYIKQTGKVYVLEAEKGVLQGWTYGDRNIVATGGKKLAQTQIDMLVRLGVDIILCFDKDVTREEIEELANQFPEQVPIYYIFDDDGILNKKESPTDNPTKWNILKSKHKYKIK